MAGDNKYIVNDSIFSVCGLFVNELAWTRLGFFAISEKKLLSFFKRFYFCILHNMVVFGNGPLCRKDGKKTSHTWKKNCILYVLNRDSGSGWLVLVELLLSSFFLMELLLGFIVKKSQRKWCTSAGVTDTNNYTT